jgi:hypothetical protein
MKEINFNLKKNAKFIIPNILKTSRQQFKNSSVGI